MKAKTIPTKGASRRSLTPARKHADPARRRIVRLLAVVLGAVSVPDAVTGQPQVSCKVTVCTPENGTMLPSPGTHNYLPGATVAISATPAERYYFAFWSYSATTLKVTPYNEAIANMTVNGDGYLCAMFEPLKRVTVCTPTNGTVSPRPGLYEYRSERVLIPATPAAGYRFVKWNTSGGLSVDPKTKAEAGMTVYGDGSVCPVFEPILPYGVRICSPTHGTVDPSPGFYPYGAIQVIPISAKPDAGYRFVRWDCNGVTVADPAAANTTMTVNANGSLCPQFEPDNDTVAVPNVVGLTRSHARAELTAAGLTAGTITDSSSQTVPSGQVISQNPVAGTQAAPGSAVHFTISTGAPTAPAAPEPVAHWRLDEKEGRIAFDSIGPHGGILYGGPVWLPNGGMIGGALEFDGVDDYVSCGSLNPSVATGQLTVCLWANWGGRPQAAQGLIAKRDSRSAGEMMWQVEAAKDTGILAFSREGSRPDCGHAVLPVGDWAHVAASFDGTTAIFYVNGQRTGSGAFSFGSDPLARVVFGAAERNGVNPFRGALDDIQLYDQALSQAQIQVAMTGTVQAELAAEELVAHWALDETTGRLASDSAGICHGVLLGGPVWRPTDGKVGGALLFDGVDDCVVTDFVPRPPEGPFRVLAWVKGGAVGQAVLSQDGAMGGTDWLAAGAAGQLMTGLGGGQPLASSQIITDGQWHEVGLTWDGTGRMLYVDGTAVAMDKPTGSVDSMAGLNIGVGRNLDAGTYWAGLIDDVRIYDRTGKP